MRFLFPYFLFALTAVAVPIIIHLFNFRRFKTVYFSNVEFLKNIKKESKRKSKLKQLLILIARILVVTCMVIAFAQPYIPVNEREKRDVNQVVAVYIDNSFSMNARGEQGQLIESARNKAIEIARTYKPGTKFIIITNDLQPIHNNLLNNEQFIREVTEIEPSPNVIPVSQIYNRLKELLNSMVEDADKNIYFLSDFQRTITDFEKIESDSTIWSYLLPFYPQASGNLYIDSCWFETPSRKINEEEELFIRIKNRSDQDYQDLPLRFFLNDSLKSLTSFSIAAQGEMIASLKFTNLKSGFQRGKVELTDYPVTYDNTWYLSYNVQPEVRVLAIYEGNDSGLNYIRALFTDDDYAKLDIMNSQSLQVSRLGDYNTIILLNLRELTSGFTSELEEAVANGASLIVFPEMDANVESYNRFFSGFGANIITGIDTMKQALAGIALDNPVYRGIFREMEENTRFPDVKGHYIFTGLTRIPETRLLWFSNDDKALGSVAHGDGFLHTFSFPLNNLNEAFARDIIFVPTIYSLVLNSIPRQDISYTIGRDNFVLVRQNRNIANSPQLLVKGANNNTEFIPDVQISDKNKLRIGLENRISESGFYNIRAGENTVAVIAFNYNRNESDMRYFETGELKDAVSGFRNISVIEDTEKQFSEIFDEIQNGKQLWKLFIILALVFVATEAAIIRFWK
ncbi:MAG: BatA domain-containing protein [Prolixibacteraceae bacterium]|nr:BatA domain-containing protein [Prolixibacteraceae bacterium]